MKSYFYHRILNELLKLKKGLQKEYLNGKKNKNML